MIEQRGLPWIETQGLANIIHAIGKMRLKNQSTKRILDWISTPDIASQFVKEGESQAVANTLQSSKFV